MAGRTTRNQRSKFQSNQWVAGGEVFQNNEVELNVAPQEDQEMVPVEEAVVEAPEEGGPKRRPWQKIGPDGKVIKKKPNPKRRNAVLRKALHPKSAIMCLNELQTGLVYDVEAMAPVGNFCASVEVNGVVFRGYGTSKANAKQAAAEAALVSFVKPPPPKPAPGENPTHVEDDTPWKSIASFAMYKLFSEWSEGKVGNSPLNTHVNQVTDLRHHLDGHYNQQQSSVDMPDVSSINMHLSHTAHHSAQSPPAAVKEETKSGNTSAPKPAKTISDEMKINNHPVMILHQLMPTIKYDSAEEINGNQRSYTLTACVGTTPYAGAGSSVKKAKFALAKLILKEAYGIDNIYEGK